MNVQTKNKQKGFTIIEVVLVLAIAGLIFLMVFIALPALQRNQRDTQRKNDLSRAQTAINNYQSNNRGALPGTDNAAWNGFANSYLRAGGDTFSDPARGDYTMQVSTAASDTLTFPNDSAPVYVALNSTCDGENIAGAGNRKVALRIKLEGGGVACVNN
jgi:prepilin-type N-terminal cleavage/methylation domain-containing protein